MAILAAGQVGVKAEIQLGALLLVTVPFIIRVPFDVETLATLAPWNGAQV